MAIKITTTRNASKFKKFFVYGKSGIGKTSLAKQFKNPLIITSENKNEALSDEDFTIWKVKTIKDVKKAVKNAIKKGKEFDIVFIDSLTDIHETAIEHEEPNHNHYMKAFGEVQKEVVKIIKEVRDSNSVHFCIIARVKIYQNEDGIDSYYPRMSGQQLHTEIASYFDFVFPMRMMNEKEGNKKYRYFQTSPEHDNKWIAKGSRKLDNVEKPDLNNIIKKLSSGSKKKKPQQKGKK